MAVRSITAVLLAALLSFTGVGCSGEDPDKLAQAFLTLLDDTTAVLKEIKDVDTAKAAEPKLKDLAARKAKLDEKAKATKVSKSEMDKSDAKWAQPMKEAAERMGVEIMRIGMTSPEAAQVVAASMGMN